MNRSMFNVFIVSIIAITVLNVLVMSMIENQPYQETDAVILQNRILMAQDHLREDNPDVEEGCIILASYIQLDMYDKVSHMMEPFGRCATKILGMRIDPETYQFH